MGMRRHMQWCSSAFARIWDRSQAGLVNPQNQERDMTPRGVQKRENRQGARNRCDLPLLGAHWRETGRPSAQGDLGGLTDQDVMCPRIRQVLEANVD